MKWRIVWPRFIAAINLLAALVCFVWHMLGARYPWPGNAVLLLWLSLAIAGFAFVADAGEGPHRSSRFVLCPTVCPATMGACVLPNGHVGAHDDGDGHMWVGAPVCHARHPYRRGVECSRPWGHIGGHADRQWWWSR